DAGRRHRERWLVIEIDADFRARARAGQCRETLLVKGQSDLRRVDEEQRAGLAGVKALAQDAPLLNVGLRQAKDTSQASRQDRLGLVDAEGQVGDAERHGPFPGAGGWSTRSAS